MDISLTRCNLSVNSLQLDVHFLQRDNSSFICILLLPAYFCSVESQENLWGFLLPFITHASQIHLQVSK